MTKVKFLNIVFMFKGLILFFSSLRKEVSWNITDLFVRFIYKI